jgi:hypothetical protein
VALQENILVLESFKETSLMVKETEEDTVSLPFFLSINP